MFCVSRNAYKMIIFAHSKCKRYENRKIQGVALPQKERNGQEWKSSHHGTHHGEQDYGAVLLQVDLRVSQRSVVPKRLHGSWADVEHLTHVLRVEPLVHGSVLTALMDFVHALHEVLQLGIKIFECLFLKYDKSHTVLSFIS